MGIGARKQGREPGQGTRAVPVGGGGMWGRVQVSALSWCGLGGVVSHLQWRSLQSQGSCPSDPRAGWQGRNSLPFLRHWRFKTSQGVYSLHPSFSTHPKCYSSPKPFCPPVLKTLNTCCHWRKSQTFSVPCMHLESSLHTKIPFKLTVSSLASPALMWCKSTSFNNQIMKAQHKKWLPLCSHPDPSCIKPWQRASLPLSVTLLKKNGAK